MQRRERSVLQLPLPVWLLFIVCFAVQIAYHNSQREAPALLTYKPLSNPLQTNQYAALSMGSERLASYLLAIGLQVHDNQAGRHFNYRRINYQVLVSWLDTISDLNRSSEYPMLLASRVYSQVSDESRLRQILAFIQRRFNDDPQLHWRRLAEASVIAKHQLDDLDLALEMAELLSSQPRSINIPQWARDIHFLLLANLNQQESAIAIIEAMLLSGSVTDPDEIRFLQSKLSEFQQELL